MVTTKDALRVYRETQNKSEAARQLGITRSRLRRLLDRQQDATVPTIEDDCKKDIRVVTVRTKTIRTVEDALREGNVDTTVWEVERWVLNKWDMAAKHTSAADDRMTLAATELWQVKVWLKRKHPAVRSIEKLLEELRKESPRFRRPKPPRGKRRESSGRALEIDLMDPHLGLHGFAPGSDHDWSLDRCEQIIMWAIREILWLARPYGPFDEIVFPFGNDYLHADNVHHTTTAGTIQPESLSWHHIYRRGFDLAVSICNMLRDVAPLKVKVIPGNHDRQSVYTLGISLEAWYHNDEEVEVDVSAAPYKFWKFGRNLIGFDHGHSINPQQLAGLMANETRAIGWSDARYCEWHLGDKHRKTARPIFEEQGVSVEYLAALTPANEWHKIKGLNWQKRGATGYVYDRDTGPLARVQCNLDSYTGEPMRGGR